MVYGSGGRQTFSINMPTEFIFVEQSLNTLAKVEKYISAGIETTIDVSLDLVEHSGDDGGMMQEKIPKLEKIMLDYADMERELKQFTSQVKKIKNEILALPPGTEWPDVNELLESRLRDVQSTNTSHELEKHEKFIELRQKIWDSLHPDEEMPQDTAFGDDEDLAMTQTEENYKCPYTGREMTHPMRNMLCKHNYDEEAVTEMFKGRSTVKCPVPGCTHRNKAFTIDNLEENKELKKKIEMRNRKKGRK